MSSVGSFSEIGLGVALSNKGGTFEPYLWTPFTTHCSRPGVRFADITGSFLQSFSHGFILNAKY